MIHKKELYIYIYIQRERERERERERVITLFEREIENKMRKRSIKIKKNIAISQTPNYPSQQNNIIFSSTIFICNRITFNNHRKEKKKDNNLIRQNQIATQNKITKKS